MLEEMRIRGLGVITDATLALDPGLTVVSGETGAGKTMVVTGLTLLLGGRADPGLVRIGVDQAVVEGRVILPQDSPLRQAVHEIGAELDDDTLIISRTVTAAGRSRAHVGGRAVPVGVLGELMADLLTIHGQSDQLRLLQAGQQRECLDRFGELAQSLRLFAAEFDGWRALHRELVQLQDSLAERRAEAEVLRIGIAEIEQVNPQPGEDQALRAEDLRLAHADGLLAAAHEARTALSGEAAAAETATDVSALLAAARAALHQVSEHDAQLAELSQRLDEVSYLAADVAGELASYVAGIEVDPARLAEVQQRRAQLTTLTRKYGKDIDQVLAWATGSSDRLVELDSSDNRISELVQQSIEAERRVLEQGVRLSQARIAAAQRLAEHVTAELGQLAMPKARLTVELIRKSDPNGMLLPVPALAADPGQPVAVNRWGFEDVEFRLTPHPGAPNRPVAKGASGGELSRVMLALEVVLAGTDSAATFVFDEVDSGVGGEAAVQIGRRLAALAKKAQVVVVTHLPQVAAFAGRHLVISKADDGQVTVSGVRQLDHAARIPELARMLAGQADSATAQAHARELLESAQQPDPGLKSRRS